MALADALVAVALGYARARLEELRTAALGSVDALAATLGVPPPADAAAAAADLAAARTALDAAAGALAVPDPGAAARHLGDAVGAVDRAVAAFGGPTLRSLLSAAVAWDDVSPAGIARQLGLPAALPSGLDVVDGALVFDLSSAGAVSLAPAPVSLGARRVSLVARLRVDGGDPAFSLALRLDGAGVGVGAGPVSALLEGAGASVEADLVLGVDTRDGLTVGGSAGHRIVIPARAALSALNVTELALELPDGVPDTVDLGAGFAVSLGGVVTLAVQGAGVRVRIDPGAVRAGDSPVAVSIKPPSGLGLSLDAAVVRGGGFLEERDGGYGGALSLRLGPVEVSAVGLLTLEPSFALVVVMSVSFLPPIDLSFGFSLNAVGGVVGIEHRVDPEALQAAMADGAIDHLMFPPDPVAAAPAILSTLAAVFPRDEGSFVIGPMLEIGWGRPVSFLTAQLGLILSLPDPVVIVIGRVRIALPAPQLPIVDLRASIYGEITPDHLLIRVSLRGSRIAGYAITGDIGFLLRWGGDPEFAVSAGGFHPRFSPPRELAGMARLGMDLSPPAVLTMRSESYFAVTTNSLQLGSRIEMRADIAVASVSGFFAFDALVLFSPRFMFMIDLSAGLTVRVLGVTLLGVQLQLHLEGPGPWRAEGTAEVEVLWWSVPIHVGPLTWGDDDNPPPPPAFPRQLVHAALHRNPGAWQALVPPDADRAVRLRKAVPSDTDVTVHPMGLFDVRQHAVPLETVVARVGPNPVPEDRRRVHLGAPLVDGTPAGAVSAVSDLFSAGQFLDLTDDEKLSRSSFELMPAGARLRPPGETVDASTARQVDLSYETFVADEDGVRGIRILGLADFLTPRWSAQVALLAGAAAGSELRAPGRYGSVPDPITLADPAAVRIHDKADLHVVDAVVATYTHAAEKLAGNAQQLVRLGVG